MSDLESLQARLVGEGWLEQRAESEARRFLIARDSQDIPYLLEKLRDGPGCLRELAGSRLAALGAMEATNLLLHQAERTRPRSQRAYRPYQKALHRLIASAARQPRPEQLPHWLSLLHWRRRHRLDGRKIASALATLARSAPSPRLREALEHLGEYPEARRAIEAALQLDASLPIPVAPGAETQNLPRPAAPSEDPVSAANLPLPATTPDSGASDAWWKRWTTKFRR